MILSRLRPVFGLTAVASFALLACDSDDSSTGPTLTCNATLRDTINFRALATQQTDTLTVGEVTITGSAAVNVFFSFGLGIVGGNSSDFLDGVELIRFTFGSGPADSVSYLVWMAGDGNGNGISGEAAIEAFDTAGASLGVDTVTSAGWKDVSERFNHVPLGSFTVTSQGDWLGIAELAYVPCH